MMKLVRSSGFDVAASAVVAAEVTGLAYDYLGFLGVIMTGSLILFMAVQSDLQRDGIRGPFMTERPSPSERPAQGAESDGMARFWRLAAILGAVLAVVGLAGFAFLQLPK